MLLSHVLKFNLRVQFMLYLVVKLYVVFSAAHTLGILTAKDVTFI